MLADISPTTWGSLETHHQRVDPMTRSSICRALGWTTDSIDRLLSGQDPLPVDDDFLATRRATEAFARHMEFKPDLIFKLPDGTEVVVEVKGNGKMREAEVLKEVEGLLEYLAAGALEPVTETAREVAELARTMTHDQHAELLRAEQALAQIARRPGDPENADLFDVEDQEVYLRELAKAMDDLEAPLAAKDADAGEQRVAPGPRRAGPGADAPEEPGAP